MQRTRFFGRRDRSKLKWRRFTDAEGATRFLQSVTSDFDTINNLRRWAADHGSSFRQHRDLIRHAAAHLVSGELRVPHSEALVRSNYLGSSSVNMSELPERTPKTPGERTTPSSFHKPESASSPNASQASVQPNIDVAKQIAILLAAAQSGTPFCEQCEKAKLESAK